MPIPKHKNGLTSRTRLTINWKEVDELLLNGCDGVEVAAVLGMHYQTLYDRVVQEHNISWTDYMAQKKGIRRKNLRTWQTDLAREKDRGMLIWLGKQELDQSDNPQKKEEMPGELKELVSVVRQYCATPIYAQQQENVCEENSFPNNSEEKSQESK